MAGCRPDCAEAAAFEVESLSLNSTLAPQWLSCTIAVEYKKEIPQMQVFRN
jgi:hypothetical protein